MCDSPKVFYSGLGETQIGEPVIISARRKMRTTYNCCFDKIVIMDITITNIQARQILDSLNQTVEADVTL